MADLWTKVFLLLVPDMVNVDEKEGCAVFSVRVSPGAGKTRVLGEYAGALKIAVSAAPEKGKANKAVIELLSRALGVRKSDVSVVSGETSRDKRICVKNIATDEVLKRIAASIKTAKS